MIQNTPKSTQLITFGATNSPKNEIEDNFSTGTKYDSAKNSKETNRFAKDTNKFAKESLPVEHEKETSFQKLLNNKKIENDSEPNSFEHSSKESKKNSVVKDFEPNYLLNNFLNIPTQIQSNSREDLFLDNQKGDSILENQKNNPTFLQLNNKISNELNEKNNKNFDFSSIYIPYADYFEPKIMDLNQNNMQLNFPDENGKFKNNLFDNKINFQELSSNKNEVLKNIFNIGNNQILNNNFDNLKTMEIKNLLSLNSMKEMEKNFPNNVLLSNNEQLIPKNIQIEFSSNLAPIEKEKIPEQFDTKIQIKEEYKNDLIKLENGIELLPFKNDKKNIVEGFFILKSEKNIGSKDENGEKIFLGTILTKNNDKNSFLIDGNKIEFINSENTSENKPTAFKNEKNETFSLPVFVKNFSSNEIFNDKIKEIPSKIIEKNSLLDGIKKLLSFDSFNSPKEDNIIEEFSNNNLDIPFRDVPEKAKIYPIKIDKLENIENISKLNMIINKGEESKKNDEPVNIMGSQKVFVENLDKKNALKINKMEDIIPLMEKQKIQPLVNKFDKQEASLQFSDFEQNTGESKQNKETIKLDDKPSVFEKTMSSQVNVPIVVSDKSNSDFSNPLISSATRRAIDLSNQLQARGGGVAKVQIQDEKLGTIELNIQMKKDNSVSMEIKASDSNLKTVLENNSDSLKKALDSQNISLTDFKVTSLETKTVHNTFGAMSSQNFSQQQSSNHKQQEFSFQQSLNQNSFAGNSANSFMNNNGNNYSAYLGDEFKNVKVANIGNNKINNFQNMEKNSTTNIQRGANGSIKVIV
ncbi:flagellar hook-length control protein FliK [Pigmentibacter sp. JX0631]|uniref:flagellar hook-length control protein FliK n=1 Tax=Pigmentibacter sp. JX0631 TaxID=2976982 RepID=UPI00246942BC|nr:flagellar hook-length control protein FliK [Pigmentibacter sp. JX0631]WGL60350.1 flagellar hook-length control protein FliK [Pigmentibacter sp. JX0631]